MTYCHTQKKDMPKSKIAITLDDGIVRRIDTLVHQRACPSRRQAIEEAVREKLTRLGRSRLARELSELDTGFERSLAEEGLSLDRVEWPQYCREKRVGPIWILFAEANGHVRRPVLFISHFAAGRDGGLAQTMLDIQAFPDQVEEAHARYPREEIPFSRPWGRKRGSARWCCTCINTGRRYWPRKETPPIRSAASRGIVVS